MSQVFFAIILRLEIFWEFVLGVVGRIFFLLAGIKFGRGIKLHGIPIVSVALGSKIIIGKDCRFRSRSRGNAIGVNHPVVLRTLRANAILKIGDQVGMSGGAICAARFVSIGNRVMIGANVVISDSDFHPLNPDQRARGCEATDVRSVVIEDDVWLGADVYVCKGVTIGHSSIVGAKSVVTRDVPAKAIFAGNPAKFIKFIE